MDGYGIESDFFGDKLGTISLAQLSYGRFNQECDSSIKDNDHTGLRLYAGCHVAIRLLSYYSNLAVGKRVVELGCGVGGFGLIGCSLSGVSKLVLTDGETKTETLVMHNIKSIYGNKDSHISYTQLFWGQESAVDLLLANHNDGQFFDVVIGCELMYYRTDVAALVNSVLRLTNKAGLFVHAHLFRKNGLGQELIDLLAVHDWCTYEVPHKHFLDKTELSHHPEWYRVRPLVSGPRVLLERIISENNYTQWRLFTEEAPSDDDESDSDGESDDVGMMPNMFKL